MAGLAWLLRRPPPVLRVFRHYVPVSALALLALDILVLTAACLASPYLLDWIGEGALWPKAMALIAITVFTLYVADLYKGDVRWGRRELVARLLLTLGSSGILTAAAGFAIPPIRFGRFAFVQVATLAALGLIGTRLAWNEARALRRLRRRVLVLGVSSGAEVLLTLQTNAAQPFEILGFLDDHPAAPARLPAGGQLLGKLRDFLTLVEELAPDIVVVALADMRGALPITDLLECRLRGIRIEDWPTFYEKQTGRVMVTGLRPSWLIFSDGFATTHRTLRLKRAIDVGIAVASLILAAPVMAAIAVTIRLDSRGPVIFRQRRVGQNGRIFTLRKFRSMAADAEQGSGAVWAVPADPRVTRVGRWLRKTRLDELPQLFNVLVGDMSLVGPRPERPEFVQNLQRQIPFYMGRHAVKPGITGWAQVRHQYAASVEDTLQKLQYDLYYIKNLSPFLDVLILLSTIQVILFARGAR